MTSSLSAWQIAVLAAYAAGMAGGQLLFKAAALRMPAQGTFAERLLALAHNGYFLAALAVYLGLSLVWVWLLRLTPLSRAYLFVALSFALVPLAAALAFDEPLSARFVLGAVLTVCGLILVVT
jgi:undecaprenyl phosphate-alpha-L-ara4N flippase subunit ArnE